MSCARQIAATMLMAALTAAAWAQQTEAPGGRANTSRESAPDLIRDVIYNELHDREHDSHWEYRSTCLSPTQNMVREQIETTEGPVYRILAEDGSPLDAKQRVQEEQRLDAYVHDPGAMARVEREHEEDEAHLASMMELLPRAFLFRDEPAGEDQVRRIAFRPNPKFVPSGYEARILHAVRGTMVIDTRTKRMIDMKGVVTERVDFGWGLLGHVDPGGRFEIHRRQVSPDHWKTDLVDVHVQGKILLLKTVGKDEREARSGFHPVPNGTTPAEAEQMLSRRPSADVEARLGTAPDQTP